MTSEMPDNAAKAAVSNTRCKSFILKLKESKNTTANIKTKRSCLIFVNHITPLNAKTDNTKNNTNIGFRFAFANVWNK